MSDDRFYAPTHRPPAPRQRRVGELLFEFYVERTKTFYRCELFDHGEWGVGRAPASCARISSATDGRRIAPR